jgi:hypothetical protein
MSKKNTDETRVSFTAMLKPSQITEIKRFAKMVGTTPSIMAGNLIDMGLDDAMLLEKSGFLKIVLMGKDVFNKVKTKIMKGEQIEVKDMII